MNCCTAPLKIILFIINLLFWAAGAFLIYAGVHYIQSNDGSLAYHQIWPAVIIFASAGILIFSGVIGCAGTVFEKKSCLGVFLLLLAITMILEACGAGIMLAKRTSTTDTFDDFALSQFEQYGNVSTYDSAFNTTDFIDEIQQSLQCCGYENYTNWGNESYMWSQNHDDQAPKSCCKVENANCTGNFSEPELLFDKGCKEEIRHTFRIVYDLVAYTALALTILVFIGMLIVIGLLYRQRNKPLGYSQLSPGYTEA